MSDNNRNKSHKKKNKKHYVVLPYFTKPLLFVLISLIIFVPVGIISLNIAVDKVHDAQQVLTINYNDVTSKNSYFPSNKSSGNINYQKVDNCNQYGNITCENAGLNTDVYYGINRVSLRNGVASSAKSGLPGENNNTQVFGYNKYLKSLTSVKVGDIITFTTFYGTYQYKVNSIKFSNKNMNFEQNNIQNLIICGNVDSKPFDDGDNLYVVAQKISGPNMESGVDINGK